MSVEAYNAWLQEPEQVAAMNAIKEAEEAEVLSKLIAKDEAAISEFMGIWECTRPQAIYELTWRNVLQIVKE